MNGYTKTCPVCRWFHYQRNEHAPAAAMCEQCGNPLFDFMQTLDGKNLSPEVSEFLLWRVQEMQALMGFLPEARKDDRVLDWLEAVAHGPHKAGPRYRRQVKAITEALNRAVRGRDENCPRGIHVYTQAMDGRRCAYCGDRPDAENRNESKVRQTMTGKLKAQDVRALGSRITDVEKLRDALCQSRDARTRKALIELFERGEIEAWMYKGEPHFLMKK